LRRDVHVAPIDMHAFLYNDDEPGSRDLPIQDHHDR
jgi:hypothetical protein